MQILLNDGNDMTKTDYMLSLVLVNRKTIQFQGPIKSIYYKHRLNTDK